MVGTLPASPSADSPPMASRRRHPQPQGIGLGPVFAILGIVVLAGAVMAFLGAKKAEENQSNAASQSQPEKEWEDPFADVQNKVKLPTETRKLKDLSPPGLMETDIFKKAEALAKEGQELADEAFAAQKSGDIERFREVGVQARTKLLEATRQTADWWIDLNEKYPNDRQVEKISRVRDKWDRSLKPLRAIK